jgi:two-component system, chemotaxis family, CheB/CheR fusion protein
MKTTKRGRGRTTSPDNGAAKAEPAAVEPAPSEPAPEPEPVEPEPVESAPVESAPEPEPVEPVPSGRSRGFPIVGIGASAGGMEAFIELLRQLPPDMGMALVLIQHLDPTHASYLSEALARSTSFPVDEIRDGMLVQPDHVYVIPSIADIGILKGELTLLPRPADGRKPHLPIDVFFKALAADRGNQAIGVVLSGTGSDGSEGLRAIKAEDGITFAQDPRSAKFSGMPEAAIRTGAVDFILPLPDLAQELVRIGRHPFLRARDAEVLGSSADDGELKKVFLLLRSEVGVDFSEYRLTTIRRRLARRMALRRLSTLEEYVRRLREDPSEAQDLFADIFIHVTGFFRDPAAFERLKQTVFPKLLEQKREDGTIRIWCAGCSTGEEAYSIVIALLEFLAKENASHVPIQLFGTDVSEHAIATARAGFYPEGVARDIGAERRAHFFTGVEGGGYRIHKSVRERCAFVKHDLASDTPFSKLDLVSCRNVLIYFGEELQRRVLATFQFALNQPGFLFLGHAENIIDGAQLFQAVDKENKIFARSATRTTLRLAPARGVSPLASPSAEPGPRAATSAELVRRTETILLEQYAPPGVIVNERMEILHFRGRTGAYLEPAPGQPQHDLLKMARRGLLPELHIAISQAKTENAIVSRSGAVELDGSTHPCTVIVIPVASPPESREHIFAVLFEEPRPPGPQPEKEGAQGTGPATVADVRSSESRVTKLEDELKATKAYLHSILEEHQHTNEELLSANEELVSSNEELQTLNEELETAKEELQSINEELSTLNEELQGRNTELTLANSDLVNILGSVEIPLIIVDGGRRVRRFTPQAQRMLNLLPSDVGRPIDDLRPNLAIEDLDRKLREVIATVTLHEEEAQGRDGRWYRLQIRPYTTVDKRIDGAVLSIVDIDVLKRALGAAEWARDYARATVEAVQTPLLVLDERLHVVSANEAFLEGYGPPQAEGESGLLYEVMNRAWDVPELRSALAYVLAGNGRFQKLAVQCELPRLGPRSLSLSGRSVSTASGERMVLLAVEDTTERLRGEVERARLLEEAKAAKANAEDANRTKDIFLATLSHELRTPLSSLLLHAQLLRRGQMDEDKIRRSGEAIERAARAQAQLIDDLLDVSRILAGKLKVELRPVGLAAIAQAAVETVGAAAAMNQVDLEVRFDDSRPTVSGDPMRLQQVVSNLLTNAIKFTSERGRVIVTVDSVDGHGRIRVADTGIGIEAAFLPHIFNRFSQEDRGLTRTHGGLGLGLAIVRHVVEVHGGTIQAESPGADQGSTFTLLLPLLPARSKLESVSAPAVGGDLAAAAPAPAVDGIKDARVLVVEDDPAMRDALSEMLGANGADVRAAASPQHAMKIFEEFRPALLVCDIAMPEEDGYSFLGRVRALGSTRGGNVPALALTALAGEEDRRRAFAAGFQVFLAKPVDSDELVAALTALLERPAPPAGVQRRPDA